MSPASKPCCICHGESCVVIPSFAAPQHLCLLHYYATGAHRGPPSAAAAASPKKIFVEVDRMERQLPRAQEVFAEAFLELQRDIREESVRALESASATQDPLAILLGSTATAPSSGTTIARPFQKQSKRVSGVPKKKTTNDDTEGGFLREAVLPERFRKLQQPKQLDDFASTFGGSVSTTQGRKRPIPKPNAAGARATALNQRKKRPSVNVWNQILDANDDNGNGNADGKTTAKMKWEDMEKKMIDDITTGGGVVSKTCSACGSSRVEIVNADITNRSNDSMKGEVWGCKNRGETVVEKCYCASCGHTWNDE